MTSSKRRAADLRYTLASLLAAATVSSVFAGPVAAEPEHGANHNGWGHDRGSAYTYQRGEHMGRNDWGNAPVVDYRARHLRRPRAGYEWREHNGNYVMVAIASGLIASVILGHH